MLKIKSETFKDIVGYEGLYQIGNKGTVISFSRSNDDRYKNKQWVLKQYEDRNGYMYVTLSNNKIWNTQLKIIDLIIWQN